MNRYSVLCTITMCVKCVTLQVHVGMGLIKGVCIHYMFRIQIPNCQK